MLPSIISTTCTHLFYALVWLRPDLIRGGVNSITQVSIAGKGAQLMSMAAVMYRYASDWRYYEIKVALIIIGQILNLTVYNKLGLEGVYYGGQFKKLPMITSFPYNITPNPQYIGCMLTQYGVFLFYPYREMLIISVYSMLWYILTSEIEKIPKIKIS